MSDIRKMLGKLRKEYFTAKANSDHTKIQKISRENFSWVTEYLFDFMSAHKSKMLARTQLVSDLRTIVHNAAYDIEQMSKKDKKIAARVNKMLYRLEVRIIGAQDKWSKEHEDRFMQIFPRFP